MVDGLIFIFEDDEKARESKRKKSGINSVYSHQGSSMTDAVI